ncbi:hypothetical protein J6590_046123 [Homalodisca vitripennis]|nr:hypothetical protein J6590_046123 [Homalodisca vitripennis]
MTIDLIQTQDELTTFSVGSLERMPIDLSKTQTEAPMFAAELLKEMIIDTEKHRSLEGMTIDLSETQGKAPMFAVGVWKGCLLFLVMNSMPKHSRSSPHVFLRVGQAPTLHSVLRPR